MKGLFTKMESILISDSIVLLKSWRQIGKTKVLVLRGTTYFVQMEYVNTKISNVGFVVPKINLLLL